jgi:long-subunit acyl-CoA synthetase (AMP-forming)
MRLLISGGSALPPETMKTFRGLGFNLYEGYGMTESSPVLTVTRPGDEVIPGSVGRALPGIDVRIDSPDASGIGEVVAKGPNVMVGYFENPEATAATIVDGWLHTGDLGRMDADGNLFIVGRKKEMILGPSGENVYPDELEELYGDSPWVKELSVVGLPAGDGAETVAALIVPDYEHGARIARACARRSASTSARCRQAAPAAQAAEGRAPVGPRSAQDLDPQGQAQGGREGARAPREGRQGRGRGEEAGRRQRRHRLGARGDRERVAEEARRRRRRYPPR